jgi:hypothetical protein
MIVESSLDARLVTIEVEVKALMAMTGQSDPGDHDAYAFITAHRVDCDPRLCPHLLQLLEQRIGGLRPDRNDFTAIIMPARAAHIVRTLEFAAI